MIRLEGITKEHTIGDSIVHAIRNINLQIVQGEYVAIMGPSGSGKSTLMNILGCLDRPTGGTYWLDDAQVSTMTDTELATVRNRHIGFVFQAFNLLPRMTALQNVMVPLIYGRLPKAERVERAKAALLRVGLEDRIHHRPNELSGGQRQRVAIARALVTTPTLILADEPTGNLDTKTGDDILGIFERLHAEGVTLIVVTHDIEVARRARRIVTFRDGSVISDTAYAGQT
jgi:putative ABC transport system ATP-binding protein